MRHGRHAITGEPCAPRAVRVTVGNRTASAVNGCVCGLSEWEGRDVETVAQDLADELRMLDLDVPYAIETTEGMV